MNKIQTITHNFDVAIIGSGAAGLKAAIEAGKNGAKKVAIISKVIPTNSHTVAAKGGINASLGNVNADDWRWHAFDTMKGSDYLADEDAVEILCKNAKSAILELEEIGVVFSRDKNGKIAQRAYGGQSVNFGKGEVAYRACYSKDKTGQTILHSLYNEAMRFGISFFSEFFVFDLLLEDKICKGCIAIDLNQGKIAIFNAKSTIIATGGHSQIYRNTTSSQICTGDGNALAFRNGAALKDMEFIQFHPTGIYGQGFLISEAARGEGAYLLNSQGNRFMKNYDEKMMELSSRDKISRAIAIEIAKGRGCGKDKRSIYLDMRHLSRETLTKKLPGIVETAKNFARIDVFNELIEIAPTAHYTMGGIDVNINCEALDENSSVISGLFAIGETACVSVHGANRLGCNSLLDLVVFGKIAGKNAANSASNGEFKNVEQKIAQLSEILQKEALQNQESLEAIKIQLQNANEQHLGVFRSQESMQEGYEKLLIIEEKINKYGLKNKSLFFNDELIAYLELKNLLLNSFTTNLCAQKRKESRGAHFRDDYPKKDDENWLRHSRIASL